MGLGSPGFPSDPMGSRTSCAPGSEPQKPPLCGAAFGAGAARFPERPHGFADNVARLGPESPPPSHGKRVLRPEIFSGEISLG